jgi:hypothetical protein
MEQLFIKASRLKLRFNYKGSQSVDDLWDLPLTALDSIFKDLNKKVKAQAEESLLNTRSKEDELIEMAIEIIKFVVATKQAENKAKVDAQERKQKIQRLLEIKDKKQNASLEAMSVEDIDKEIAALKC